MSDFAEKITLDLNGTAVDGSAAHGIQGTSEGLGHLLEDLKKLASTSEEVSFAGMVMGVTALGTAAVATGAIVGSVMGDIMASTSRAAADVEKYTMQIASAYGNTDTWAGSMERASRVIPGLQKSAILTGASIEEMAKSFRSLSLLTDGTNAQVLAVTNSLTVMARTAGISADTLISQIQRAALTGQLWLRGEGGREIALNMFPGLSPSEIGAQLKAANEAGTLLDLLSSKMGDQNDKAKMLSETWDSLGGSWSKISASLKAEIGVTWDPLRVLFADIRDLAMSDEFREIAKAIGQIGKETVAAELANWVGLWVGFKDTMKSVLSDLAPIYQLLVKIGAIAPPKAEDVSGLLTSSHKLIPGTDTMTQLDLASIKKGRDEFEKLFETLDREHTLAGLTGIDKTLAEISAKEKKETDDVQTKWAAGYLDVAEKAKALALVQDTAAKNRSVALDAEAAKEAALAAKREADAVKWSESIARAYQKVDDLDAAVAADLARIRKGTSADPAEMIQEEVNAQIEATNKLAEIATKRATEEAALNEGRLKDGSDLASKLTEIEQARVDKDVALEAAASLKEKTILDARSGNWTGYYDDLVQQAIRAGAGIVEAMQESLRTVADKAYANAATIEQGVQAFLLKIRSELKTEGQIWSDYLTGVSGGVTTGLDTALQHLESGTGSLKDAWKAMLDGMLKSLNTTVEEMVKKWLSGTKEMGAGGGLDSLFGGSTQKATLDSQGNVVYQGGTINATTKGQGTQGVVQKQAPGGVPDNVIGAAGLTALAGVAAISGADTVLGGGIAQAGIQLGALVATYVNVLVGVIIAAIGVIVQALMPRQSEFTAHYVGSWMATALETGHAAGPAGSDLEKATTAALSISNSMTGFFSDMFKDVDPAVRLSILEDLNKKMKAYFASLGDFGAHAGSGSDFQTDISKIFTEIIPKQIMHAMFGQTTTQVVAPGGITGGGTGLPGPGSGFSAADPNSPLVSFLTGIGFTIDKVNEIAGQIDVQSAEDFQKYFSGLVGVVVSAQALAKKLSLSYADTVAGAAADAAKSPAGKLAEQAANVTALLQAVSLYSGDEQVTKGQEAIAAAQQFYDNAKAAMLQLSAMAKQTTQDVADETKKIQDSLKSPSELFDQSFTNLQADYLAMKNATNPEDLAKAWASAKSDFEAVAGELVNRIKQIQSLLDDIHTLQLAIAGPPAPDQNAAPGAWLRQNMLDITKYEAAMKAANPGSPEEISAATTMAGLIRDRYQMELQLLDRIKSAISSINDTIDQQLFNIDLGEAKTPDDKAKLIYGKIEELYKQMQAPGLPPEQMSALVSQITGLTGQLLQLSPAGTSGHDAMVEYVKKILEEVRTTSTGILGGQADSTKTDISKLGDLLAGAEKRLSDSLDKDKYDLEALQWHFKMAGKYMTDTLNDWGVEIAAEVSALDPVLKDMVKNFTDVNAAVDGTGTGTGDGGGHVPLGDNLTGLGSGVSDARDALTNFTNTVNDATAALGGKAA